MDVELEMCLWCPFSSVLTCSPVPISHCAHPSTTTKRTFLICHNITYCISYHIIILYYVLHYYCIIFFTYYIYKICKLLLHILHLILFFKELYEVRHCFLSLNYPFTVISEEKLYLLTVAFMYAKYFCSVFFKLLF